MREYNHSLCWFEKYDCWWADESFLIKQLLLISRVDKSNWYSKSSARLLNLRSSCVWTTETDEYRLNFMIELSVSVWEICNESLDMICKENNKRVLDFTAWWVTLYES